MSRSSWTAAGRRAAAAFRGTLAWRRAVRAAVHLNISFVTIFSFLAENWSPLPEEVRSPLGLLNRFIRNDLPELRANNVRVRIIGACTDLVPDIAALLREAEQILHPTPA